MLNVIKDRTEGENEDFSSEINFDKDQEVEDEEEEEEDITGYG